MTIKIYNSLSKQKEVFKLITPGEIKLYVCGVTVYDYCHIGHARTYIAFDMIVRYLRARGYKVNYVRNITDIEDKIISRANENKETCDALTERFIKIMHEEFAALKLLPADHEPRATGHIKEIIQLIESLIAKGYAYFADNGDVYFEVRRFKDYGKLSQRKLDDLISGTRIEIVEEKRDPLDFVLWKKAKDNEPRWDSPWGHGRPGWHIECSAMSTLLLGQPFDIHGGGMDLKFPHHENEIAQSEAGCDQAFANIWMHTGLLQINEEKMSKSLNNFITIGDALKAYPVETLRYFMLSGHYRSPLNYSESNLQKAHQSLVSLYTALRGLPEVAESNGAQDFEAKFYQAMDDDFHTPGSFAVLFELAHEINRLREAGDLHHAAELAAGLKRLAGILGILQESCEAFLQGGLDAELSKKIEGLIVQRNAARSNKNFAEADRIRDELSSMGIAIEDGPGGTTWRQS